MNKKIIMISMVAVFVGWGAYANTVDIDANGNRLNSNPAVAANCTEPILGTYSGSTDFEAKWQANSIPLRWYSDDEQLQVQGEAGTCTYDSGLTVPSSQYQPTKRGYHFRGWTIKTGGGTSGGLLCGFTNETIDGLQGVNYGFKSDGRDPNNAREENASQYGLTTDNTWATEFSTGIMRGIASCNNTAGPADNIDAYFETIMNNGDLTSFSGATASSNSMSSSSTGQYCWCRMESYTPNGGNACNVSQSSAWVFYTVGSSVSSCAHDCAYICSRYALSASACRRALVTGSGN